MKISPKDLVRLIVEANNQGYNQAVKHSDQAYDEYAADFRKAMDEQRTLTAGAFDRGFKAAQGDYQAGLEKGRSEAENPEALAQAKSQAYEEGYKQGLQSENSYNSGLEAGVKAERERALASEPKLSVWFKPCGPMPVSPSGEVLGYPPGINKIDAIKAIREAYEKAEGYSLKEVKDFVETPSFGARYAAGQPLPQSKAVTLYLQLQAAGFDPVLKD